MSKQKEHSNHNQASGFTPAERAQLRQLLIYLISIIFFVILASLTVGLILNAGN